MFDVIIFALIAAFVVYKLKRMLGEEYENDKPSCSMCVKEVNVLQNDDRKNKLTNEKKKMIKIITNNVKKEANVNNLEEIKSQLTAKNLGLNERIFNELVNFYKTIPNFSYEDFISRAENVFEEIINAYSSQDLNVMKNFLNDKILDKFTNLILERKTLGHREMIAIVKFNSIKIVDIITNENSYDILVEFDWVQIAYVQNIETSDIIDGSNSKRHNVTERWLFSKSKNNGHSWIINDINILNNV